MASTVWRGYITFGLISIPVRLFRAARAERLALRRLSRLDTVRRSDPAPPKQELKEEIPVKTSPQPVLAPVQQVSVRKGTADVLPERSLVKGYEYDEERFVAIEPEELKAIAPKTSSGMEIEEFVTLAEIDRVYFETSYYIMPEEAGEKAYALLYRAMQVTGLVAVAQFAMHTREHVVVLRPGRTGLLAHTMFYSSEVRADDEYRADTRAVEDKELQLATTLIRSLAAPFDPTKYRDAYRERLESMIAKKVQAQPSVPAESPRVTVEVVDIADALRKSLANLKKPAASERTAKTPATTRRKKGSHSASHA